MTTFREWCEHYDYAPQSDIARADYQRYCDNLDLLDAIKINAKDENMDTKKVEIQSETADTITLKKPISRSPNWAVFDECTIGPVDIDNKKRVKVFFENNSSNESYTLFLKRYLEDQSSDDYNLFIVDEETIEDKKKFLLFINKMGVSNPSDFVDMLYISGIMAAFEARWPQYAEPE